MCLKHVKMIKIKLICHVQEIHEICPPLLTYPGWHTHGHTLIETDAIHWSGGQPITAPREHGIRCLAQRHLSRGKEVALPLLQLSVHQSILRGESGNRPSRYWTTHSNH